jgi:hypothetical protein
VSLIDNERTKLLANALDRASTACFTVGIVTPVAGYFYGIIDLNAAIERRWPLSAFLGWLILSVALHLWARRILGGLRP